jgi:ribokinase
VGHDGFAAEALTLMSEGGVDLAAVRVAATATGVALILVDQAGENVIAVLPGANFTLSEADAAGLEFGAADVLMLQLEVPVAAAVLAARRARAAGARVVLNFAPFRADGLALLPHATHLVVNETECALIAGALGIDAGIAGGTEAQAAALAQRAGLAVIATLGRDGVLAAQDGRAMRVPALPVTAIDTVGAGDTFCGYLAAGLAEGLSLEDALTLAAKAASLACTKPGAQPAIPLRAEVARA